MAIDAQENNIMNKKLSKKVNNITCHEDILLLETLIPRVLNKLTLCVYPMATIIQAGMDFPGEPGNQVPRKSLVSSEIFAGHYAFLCERK